VVGGTWRRRPRCARLCVILDTHKLLVACLIVCAPAAGAQTDEDQGENVVVLTGRAEVRGDETVDNVFVADGPAVVDGRVQMA